LGFAASAGNILCTVNAIESLRVGELGSIRNKGDFPSDDAATERIWPALRDITARGNIRPSPGLR
jgi:transposase-like protein